MIQKDEYYIGSALEVARKARRHGNHPFGAILVGSDGAILLTAENTVITEKDCTGHAETNLMRKASRQFDRNFLLTCTLYTSTEPCAMCSGAIYWGNVGRVVYGLGAESLHEMTGDDPENPTLALPCREVFSRGQRSIEVIGPVLEQEAQNVHEGFWR
ncbi:MAG: nucleoside deaminase [Chloroflexota bacterium]